MKKVIISVFVVCVALIGLAMAAGPGMDRWHPGPEEKIDYIKYKMTKELDLNETQTATLDRIADEILAEHAQLSSDRKAFKEKFLGILAKDSVSPEELKKLLETKKPVIEEVMTLASGHIAELHEMLTPEQRATLIEVIKSKQGRGCRFMR